MEPVSNSPQMVTESKMMDESKTTNNEGKYKFSDLCVEPFGVTCDVKKDIYDDEAYLYVTVKNPTADFVNISDNLTGFKQYIKGKNLVFDRCLFDFDTIKKDTEELEIYLNPGEEQQFSIHYKKPLDRVDFKELLEKQREGFLVTSEKTKQDEKNKNIEIASVDITNNGKFPFYVSKMKDYFRKDRSEGNYEFLKYTIEDIANGAGTEPDETITNENANILINANSKVRICAIYNKKAEEYQQKSDDTIKDVYCSISELDGGEVSKTEWLKDNLGKIKVKVNNSIYYNRLHVTVKADYFKENNYFNQNATFLNFSGNSIVKKTNEEIELVVDPESTGSFEVYFEEKPEDVHCSFSYLEGKPRYGISVVNSIKSGNSFTKCFSIKNNSKNKLYVNVQPDELKKYFKDGTTLFKFSGDSIIKNPDNSITVKVAPGSSSSFTATFRDMSKDLHCNLYELVDNGYCAILYHGKSEKNNLVEIEFKIKNPFEKALHITADVNYLKHFFGKKAKFSYIYEESEGKMNFDNGKFDNVTFMVDRGDSLNFKVYFKDKSHDVYCDLSKLDCIKYSDEFKDKKSNLVGRKVTIKNSHQNTLHVMVDVNYLKKIFFKKSYKFVYLYEESIGKKKHENIELVLGSGETLTFEVYFREGKSNDVHCRLSDLKKNTEVTVSDPAKSPNDLIRRTVTIQNLHTTRWLYVTVDAFYLKQQYFGENDVFSHFVDSKENNISKQIELKVRPKGRFVFKVYFRDTSKDYYHDFTGSNNDMYCTLSSRGFSKEFLKKLVFNIENTHNKHLHVNVDADCLKQQYLKGETNFLYFYGESIGKMYDKKIKLMVEPRSTFVLEVYFDDDLKDDGSEQLMDESFII